MKRYAGTVQALSGRYWKTVLRGHMVEATNAKAAVGKVARSATLRGRVLGLTVTVRQIEEARGRK